MVIYLSTSILADNTHLFHSSLTPDIPLYPSHLNSLHLESQTSPQVPYLASHHNASSSCAANSQGLNLSVCGNQVQPTPTFGLIGTHVFVLPIMRVLFEHDSLNRMPLLTLTTAIVCAPSLCLTKDKTCRTTGGTINS